MREVDPKILQNGQIDEIISTLELNGRGMPGGGGVERVGSSTNETCEESAEMVLVQKALEILRLLMGRRHQIPYLTYLNRMTGSGVDHDDANYALHKIISRGDYRLTPDLRIVSVDCAG